MNNKFLKMAVAGLVLSVSGFANSSLIVGYAPGTSSAAGVVASGITSAGSNAELFEGDSASFGDVINVRPSVVGATAGDAVAANDFFQFSINALNSNYFDLSALTFSAYNGGLTTPRGWVLRSSADAFASDIDSSVIVATFSSIGPELFSVDLSSLTALTSIAFRVYAYAPTAGYAVNFLKLEITGTVFDQNGIEIKAVPEPSNLAILALGLIGLVSRKFKKHA